MVSRDAVPLRHYFDWAATAIPDVFPNSGNGGGPGPAEGPPPFGNPSSPHLEGRAARDSLEEARSRCAAALGVEPAQIYFSSGGTESNAIVIYSHLLNKSGGQILASAAEHASVRENINILAGLGKETARIPVDESGRVSPALLSRTLEKYPRARFAAIMAVNNETGAVMDMAALGGVLRSREGPPIHFHCDIVQAAGKIVLDFAGWGLDSAALSAHKLGGPRGAGLLYLRRPLKALYAGGGQEGGIRPGSENTAGALALAACLENRATPEAVNRAGDAASRRWKTLIGALRAMDRCSLIPAGRPAEGGGFSPYILQAAFDGVPGEVMVRALDDLGFAVSTGSACSSASPERPVLEAMGVDPKRRLEGIRISQGWSTTDEEIELLIQAINEVLAFL
ncbi:MAG: aminotransferase class V-fold PLP-dependent enzyme [Treponema sp.]|jgi:cysteine desulfurase|nr:aminotransferase class V-fold PLP-dependent enzyme [Treponema sp.]